MIDNVRALNRNEALFFIMSQDKNKEFVIELNTNEQLFKDGVDSNNTKLDQIGGEYSEYTILLKQEEGLPVDRITLYNTGDFYNSFNVEVEKDGFVISANTIKGQDDLQDRWGEDILGLTDESIEQLINEIIPQFINYIRDAILR